MSFAQTSRRRSADGTEGGAREGSATVRREVILALRNGVMLTLSLLGTLAVAVAVRVFIPRFLGPESFGRLHFAEQLAAVGMFFTTLGVETYLERELATRPQHASEFFGGLIVVRLAATMLVLVGLGGLLSLMGKPFSDWRLVFVFALGQVVFVLNSSLACCLQAVAEVRELALTNVAAKLVWGAGVVLGLALGGGLLVVPLAFLGVEALKVPVLVGAARKHLHLRFGFVVMPALIVIAQSLPFYLNQVAHELYGRVGVTILSWLAAPAEVGYFGAASNVTALVLLVLPILNAVILPMSSRVALESREAMNTLMRDAALLILTVTIPIAVLLGLNAPWIVEVLFSSDYAPAARCLRVQSLLVPFTCYCVLAGMHLLQVNRIRRLTVISFIGLALAGVLAPVVTSMANARLGPGGAAMGAAGVVVLTEGVTAFLMLGSLGEAGLDARLPATVCKLLAIGGLVAGLHLVLAPFGVVALVLESAVYLGVGVLWRAIPVARILAPLRAAIRRRTDAAAGGE